MRYPDCTVFSRSRFKPQNALQPHSPHGLDGGGLRQFHIHLMYSEFGNDDDLLFEALDASIFPPVELHGIHLHLAAADNVALWHQRLSSRDESSREFFVSRPSQTARGLSRA